MPQASGAEAPQMGRLLDEEVWAAGTLNCFSSLVLPQVGQRGFSSPRMSSSNSPRH
jgi:hypothetical protein